MARKLTYFSLAAAVAQVNSQVQDYSEKNRDPLDPSTTTYYKDATSTFRIPGWMKTNNRIFDSVTNLQLEGVWNDPNSAISLGNGRIGTAAPDTENNLRLGTSTPAEKAFIDAVKTHHAGKNNVGQLLTPFANPQTGSRDPYDHVKNFWYRDGQLFALILDDNANDMMHGGLVQNQQTDVIITEPSNDNLSFKFQVRKEEHHMEHLRKYCNAMGGDLWAPSSQAEYDDIMERPGGVCDQHYEAVTNGQYKGDASGTNLGDTKTEIYLNLHRDGYLMCPDGLTQEVADDGTFFDCPNNYDPANAKRDYFEEQTLTGVDRDNLKSRNFMTTDRWFHTDLTTGMCANPGSSKFLYAEYLMDLSCNRDDISAPYIPADCFSKKDKLRFQKFVIDDTININAMKVNRNGVEQIQEDCVVTVCNNLKNQPTGPANDLRSKSEWNVEECNHKDTTGICRIRAFGCNQEAYTCKENYSRSCGDRSVYTRSVVAWADRNVETAVSILEADLAITTPAQQNILSQATIPSTFIANVVNQDVIIIPSTEDQTAVETWRNSIPSISGIPIQVRDPLESYPVCTCTCHDDNVHGLKNYVRINADFDAKWLTSTTHVADAQRTVSYITLTASNGDFINSRASWNCNEANQCYTGTVSSVCAFKENTNYEATWTPIPDLTNMCTNNCCNAYNPNIHTLAAMTQPLGKSPLSWKVGEGYEISCNGALQTAQGDAKSSPYNYIIQNSDFPNDCFKPLTCVAKQCTCPTKANGYCYTLTGKTSFDDNDQVICRCNEGYYNVNAANNLPYDILTCNSGVFSGNQGVCEPVMCSNPYDLKDNAGKFLGLPKDGNNKAVIGGRIEYECIEGYESAQAEAPFSICGEVDPATDNDDVGKMAFYSDIVGTCVRKYFNKNLGTIFILRD